MHKRNVNPIFQADVIDAKNGVRHSASITFWKASEELRTKLMETRRWRFFGLIPSNRGSDNDRESRSFNFVKRSQCREFLEPTSDDLQKRGFMCRRRVLIEEMKSPTCNVAKGKRCVVDIVAAMVGECFQNDRRFLFFVDETGSALSVLLKKTLHKDISRFRKGATCTLLNVSVYAYDRRNDVVQAEWKENSTTYLNSCSSRYRLTLNVYQNQLQSWLSSLEGKLVLENLVNCIVPKLVGGDAANAYRSANNASEIICLSKVGYITRCKYITLDAEANNADDILVDFQDAHGFQTVLKSETKLIPFHEYVRIPRKVDVVHSPNAISSDIAVCHMV